VPCGLVEIYWRFRGTYCLHHQGDHRHGWTWEPVRTQRWRTEKSLPLSRIETCGRSVLMLQLLWRTVFVATVAAYRLPTLCQLQYNSKVTQHYNKA
jgi:hypothetical protein